jgi:hypothetical protein
LSIKWLVVNEEVAYKRIMNCTNVVELRNVRKYLYKDRYNWRIKSVTYNCKQGMGEYI